MVHPPSTYTISDIEKLLRLFNPERFTVKEVACKLSLFINACGEHFKHILFEIGRTHPGWDEEFVEECWNKAMRDDGVNVQEAINTLFCWGKSDSPQDFLKWHDLHVPSLALRVYDHGDRGLAQIAHDQLKAVVKMIPGMKQTNLLFV